MQICCGNQAVNANILQMELHGIWFVKLGVSVRRGSLHFCIAGAETCARVRGPVETAMAVIPRRFVASGKTKNPFARVAQR